VNCAVAKKLLGALAPYLLSAPLAFGQEAHPQPPPPPPGAKAVKCANREIPQFTDITEKSGIKFNHVSASDNRYVIESMSGGVLLIDYDRDGYPDIYFTNAPTVDMAIKGKPRAAPSIATIATEPSPT
jgi:hypothetical protein